MSKKISELSAATTPLAGTELLEVVQGGVSKKVAASAVAAAAVTARTMLTAARTYYVRTDGSDSNDGLANNAGGAFLTIQKAIDIASALDNGGFDITIRISAGTFTAANVLKSFVGSGKIIIRGDNNDMTSTVVSTTSDSCFKMPGAVIGDYQLEYMKLQTAAAGSCLMVAAGQGILSFGNINFGAAAWDHITVGSGCRVTAIGNYTISGGANSHYAAADAGLIVSQSITITLSGTPNFSIAFAFSSRIGSMLANALTFSGAATGKRYDLQTNALIFTGGGGANYFPGNSAGTTASGGQYV